MIHMNQRDILAGFAKRINEVCDDRGLAPHNQGRQVALAKLFGVSQKGGAQVAGGGGNAGNLAHCRTRHLGRMQR